LLGEFDDSRGAFVNNEPQVLVRAKDVLQSS